MVLGSPAKAMDTPGVPLDFSWDVSNAPNQDILLWHACPEGNSFVTMLLRFRGRLR
jgi:hypothetical protein